MEILPILLVVVINFFGYKLNNSSAVAQNVFDNYFKRRTNIISLFREKLTRQP